MTYLDKTGLFLTALGDYEIMVGRHPQSSDTFSEEEIKLRKNPLLENGKKTVSLHKHGKEALILSVLEVDEKKLSIRKVSLINKDEVMIDYLDGKKEKYKITNLMNKNEQPIIYAASSYND